MRLAAGLDDTNKLSKKSIEIAIETLARMNERLRGMPLEQVRAVGTQTLRQARNVNDFLVEAQNALGYPIEVISGREEARLVFEGCMHTLPPSESAATGRRHRRCIDRNHRRPRLQCEQRRIVQGRLRQHVTALLQGRTHRPARH